MTGLRTEDLKSEALKVEIEAGACWGVTMGGERDAGEPRGLKSLQTVIASAWVCTVLPLPATHDEF